MIIGIKYWQVGDAVPTTWTDLDVLECYARPWRKSFVKGEAFDGLVFNHRRKYLRVTLRISPLVMNTAAARAIVEAAADSYYIAVRDTRHAYLGASNTVAFVHAGDTEWTRSAPTQAVEEGAFELVSEVPI